MDLLNELIKHAAQERFSEDVAQAKNEYQKQAGEIFEDDLSYENRATAFLEWYLFDHTVSGLEKSPLQIYLDENANKLSEERFGAISAFQNNIHGIFIPKKIREDHVIALNLFDEQEYQVVERQAKTLFNKKDVFEARLLPCGDNYCFSGYFGFHPPETLKFIKKEAGNISKTRKEARKELDRKQSDLEKLEARLKKTESKREKLKRKLETKDKPSLKEKMDQVESLLFELKSEFSALEKSIEDWKHQKLKIEHNRACKDLILKFSYMNLKWERSRNIALNDIYKS